MLIVRTLAVLCCFEISGDKLPQEDAFGDTLGFSSAAVSSCPVGPLFAPNCLKSFTSIMSLNPPLPMRGPAHISTRQVLRIILHYKITIRMHAR